MRQLRITSDALATLLAMAIMLAGVALLLPAKNGSGPSPHGHCTLNLMELQKAILLYAEVHGQFPPAYTVDAQRRPLHSWRTLILPQLDQQGVYDLVDLSKPWDAPANAAARAADLDTFRCPSCDLKPGMTTYLAVSGPDCAFNGSTPRKLSEVQNGGNDAGDEAGAIMIIDADEGHAVHWMSPQDATPDAVVAIVAAGDQQHPEMIFAANARGGVRSLERHVDEESLRRLLSITDAMPPH